LIKQFREMKIMLTASVTKAHKLEQSSNKNSVYCKNCRGSDHYTQNCSQLCKICQGNLGTHPFWKCPNYINNNNSNIHSHNAIQVNQGISLNNNTKG